MKTGAVVLLVWYCMSIIGFDVHTCRGSGRSFVTTMFCGLSCEDIHPEHLCHDSHCHDCCGSHGGSCGGHADVSVSDSRCCTDDLHFLLLTGVSQKDEHSHYDVCNCGHCPCVECPQFSYLSVIHVPEDIYDRYPDPGSTVPADVQSLLNIWRI